MTRILFAFIFLTYACGEGKETFENIENISSQTEQDSLFKSLLHLTNEVKVSSTGDTLAFLILPIHASCPYCRKKTIANIVKYQDQLPDQRYIIISARGGRKFINSFFREQGEELPVIEDKLFLDSANHAFDYNLVEDKPTIYYTYHRKVFKRVSSMPATVNKDLKQFFSKS